MGYFKSRRIKHEKIKLIIRFICIILLIFIIFNFINHYIKIDKKYLKFITSSYLKMDFLEKNNNSKKAFKEEKVNEEIKNEPIVYIYNTHQSECYNYNKINPFNINYDVLFASQILASYLNENNINSIVEKNSINDIILKNNYTYADSYKASRILLEQSIIDNPSLKYFIDLHRDAAPIEATTCDIDGKSYAKIMFVLGLENSTYHDNEIMMNKLNDKLNNINPCLSRGINKKEGFGVNGVYNQDFNKNTILIEVGGQYNTIEEVNNTLKIFSSIFKEYIEEEK